MPPTGNLSLKFTAAAEYPLTILRHIPQLTKRLQETNDKLMTEETSLLQIMQTKWKGEQELMFLRQQREELQRRIDATLTATTHAA
jgi:hypothetical protein